MHRIFLIFTFFFIGLFLSFSQKNHKISIEFSGIKADKGDVYVALYNTEDSFLKTPYKGDIVKVNNKKAIAVFKDIPEGDYAISAFHDENDNKKMDTKIFGIPKEPIGISNNAKGFFGPPKYKDAKFTANKDITLQITMN